MLGYLSMGTKSQKNRSSKKVQAEELAYGIVGFFVLGIVASLILLSMLIKPKYFAKLMGASDDGSSLANTQDLQKVSAENNPDTIDRKKRKLTNFVIVTPGDSEILPASETR
ncbi:MAG: hypothetical protein U0525_02990 [Patescibacteria group bacterium]